MTTFLQSLGRRAPWTIRNPPTGFADQGHTALQKVLRQGLDALALTDGSKIEARSENLVSSYRSPFAAALIAAALAKVPGSRIIVKPLLLYLHQTVEPPGLWHFSRQHFPRLPTDADDTACVLAALLLNGEKDVPIDSALEVIQHHARGEGPCRTWLTAGDTSHLPGGENDVDVVVNVNVLYCAALAGRNVPGAADFVSAWVISHGIECQQGSAYYTSPFAFAYFLARWLRQLSSPLYMNLTSLVATACAFQISRMEENALAVALGLNTLLDLRPMREEVEGLAERLMACQGVGGLWPAQSFFLGPHGMTFGSAALTTAFALEALAKLQRFRQFGKDP